MQLAITRGHLKQAWDSPTIMTWMSYSTKALSLFGVLPLILKEFSEAEVALWYLFASVISLQSLVDSGFRQTFTRFISYAYSGAEKLGIVLPTKAGTSLNNSLAPNKALLASVISVMRYVYLRLTLLLFFILLSFGTWALIKPVNSTQNISESWISWGIIILVSLINLYGKVYSNFLEGLFKIALVRRVETFTSLGSIICSFMVLIFTPSLLLLVFVNQLWVVISIIRDWYLSRKIENNLYYSVWNKIEFDKEIFKEIWNPSWRSGISSFMSVGLTNLTGLVYAQFGSVENVASYLLALRMINQVKDISMAPFYSKIPLLAMLRIKNDLAGLLHVVRRGMILSHLVFVGGFISIGLAAEFLLENINSNVEFVDQNLWFLIGIAFFVHRFGAMHIQVYLSTNHIISHIADGVSGIIYIASCFLLCPLIGIYGIPVSMLAGYLGFYSWYAAKNSYKSLNVKCIQFERNVSFLPILILVCYFILIKLL